MAVLLFAASAALMLTAALAVSMIGTSSPVSFLLGAYALAWAEAVGLALILSPFQAFGRTGLLVGSLLAAMAAACAWIVAGRPRPPAFLPALRVLRTELADPVLAILAAVVGLSLAYAVVLGVASPQNEWDSLTYHLTRAAFWIQQDSVSYIPNAADVRINGNPPNAEIGQAWTMLLGGSDRFVWLPSLGAVPALMLGICGVARRAGLHPREALFGALLFACLPLVVLQSSTAMNDLAVASFFLIAAYFAIGTSRAGALGAVLALGLAFGTKISAPLLLPIYLVVVLVARRRRFVEQIVIVILGVTLGGVWYVVNLAHTGVLDGGISKAGNQTPDRHPTLVLARAYQLLLNTIELPGASRFGDMLLFVGCATAIAIAAAVAHRRGHRPTALALAGASAIVYAAPFLLLAEGTMLTSSWRLAWAASGRHDSVDYLGHFNLSTTDDSAATWYGPIGALFFVGGVVLALRTTAGRRHLRVALALAPLIFLFVLAASVPWDPWRGRFFVFPIALAAAAWGLAYSVRALAWAAAGLSVVTVVLVVVHSNTKPPGIPLLAPATTPSVFGKPRWQVQTWIRDDHTDAVVRFFETAVPSDASVGLLVRGDEFTYPYFGAHLDRTVRFLVPGEPAPADADWIVVAPGLRVPPCPGSWTMVLGAKRGFRVLRRTAADTC